MSDFEVTDKAAELGEAALLGYNLAQSDMFDAASDVLTAAGPVLVAAELRRIADLVPAGTTRTLLLNRADELVATNDGPEG